MDLAGLLVERVAESSGIMDSEHLKFLELVRVKLSNFKKLITLYSKKSVEVMSASNFQYQIYNGSYLTIYWDEIISTSKR